MGSTRKERKRATLRRGSAGLRRKNSGRARRHSTSDTHLRNRKWLFLMRSRCRSLQRWLTPCASAKPNDYRKPTILTKLHNARYLRQFLLNEIRRARRYGSSVAALFLDLDDFKKVNDAHGHLAGSHVLMEMAAVILSSIRDTDAVARYGGDEFVIVLPDTGDRSRRHCGRAHPRKNCASFFPCRTET